jgi:hypothetical protein
VKAALAEALPDGLDILQVVESPGGSLADRLEGSHWQLDLADADPEQAAAAVATFLGTDAVMVERMTKKGLREFDCRAAVVSLSSEPEGAGARLQLVLRQTVPAVRPDDVLTGLAAVAGFEAGEAPLLTRLAQGPLHPGSGRVGDPLEPPA